MKYITVTERGGENSNTFTLSDIKWNALMGAMLHGCGAPPEVEPSDILCLIVRPDLPYEDGFVADEHNTAI
jgi:hypothetical protein